MIDRTVHSIPALASDRFELKVHTIDPEDITPLGDRYVVEVITMDEKVLLGSVLVVTQEPEGKAGDPMADPTIERRGVLAAVVIAKGNGHLLGLPDPKAWSESKGAWQKAAADVPMFYEPGDIIFVDHNAKGRALKIVGREIRIVNQIDILARLDGVTLERTESGWQQVEA
jgi:co-chaperonin GroES (HSP10)